MGLVRHGAGAAAALQRRRDVWVRLGVWLLLALEFELAADIVRTVIAPTWARLGQLAAIAVIRTFLNYFLEKDVERALKAERADWDSRAKAA